MKNSALSALQEIDHTIRQGRAKQAQKQLFDLTSKKLPRTELAAVAALARRAGIPALAIKLLNPIVRPHPKSPMKATDEEKAEYAECLTKIGASDEALGILSGIDPKSCPQVLLYQASAHMSHWNYAGSIPHLTKYVRVANLDPYQRLVGKVNLAAAFVYERMHSKATLLLREILYDTSLKRLDLLLGNALELAAQNFVLQRKWNEAERCLKKAQLLLKNSDTLDEFFVKKWAAIVAFEKAKKGKKPIANLRKIREEASERGHWETMRQCDRFEAMATENHELLQHLYFGTPYDSYRARLLREFGETRPMPPNYLWHLKGKSPSAVLPHILAGEKTKRGDTLKVGQLLHRLLTILSADFYRPIRVAAVYARVYPGEYFNPVTSPARVHEAVKRLRQWFEYNRIPLEIEESAGMYTLKATGACALRIPLAIPAEISKSVFTVEKLRAHWPSEPFSIKEASKFLKMPLRSTLRLLEESIKASLLIRTGKGRATRYLVSPASRLQEAHATSAKSA